MARDPKIRISEKPCSRASGWWCATAYGKRRARQGLQGAVASSKLFASRPRRLGRQPGMVGRSFLELADKFVDDIRGCRKEAITKLPVRPSPCLEGIGTTVASLSCESNTSVRSRSS